MAWSRIVDRLRVGLEIGREAPLVAHRRDVASFRAGRFFSAWKTSEPSAAPRGTSGAPTGTIMNSWMSSCCPRALRRSSRSSSERGACARRRRRGSGRAEARARRRPPWRSAIETPRIALAPRFSLFGVPSRSSRMPVDARLIARVLADDPLARSPRSRWRPPSGPPSRGTASRRRPGARAPRASRSKRPRGPPRGRSAADQGDLHLHGRIAARVENFARENGFDLGHWSSDARPVSRGPSREKP